MNNRSYDRFVSRGTMRPVSVVRKPSDLRRGLADLSPLPSAGEFTVKAWGIYTKQKLLITCDSRASAEELLDPDETLVRVVAKCVPVKKGKC